MDNVSDLYPTLDGRFLNLSGTNVNQNIYLTDGITDYNLTAEWLFPIEGINFSDDDNTKIYSHGGWGMFNDAADIHLGRGADNALYLNYWNGGHVWIGRNTNRQLVTNWGNLTVIEGIYANSTLTVLNNSNFSGSLYPMDTLTYNIGAPTYRWNGLYVGFISADEINTSGNINSLGYVNATTYYGSGLTLDGINITGGVINVTGDFTGYAINTSYLYGANGIGGIDMRGSPWYFSGADWQFAQNVDINQNLNVDGNTTASYFFGNGSQLTDIEGTLYYADEFWINKNTTNAFIFNATKFNPTYHNATEAEAEVGIIDGGTLVDTQHQDAQYDGHTFNFSEEAGAPGLDMYLNFTGLDVDTFGRGIMRYKTSPLSGDFPIVQMWSYTDNEWEDYPSIVESETFATMTQPVFDGASHIQDGVAQMRLYKASNGNTQNHYYIDWIAIISGYGLPIGEEVDPDFNAWLNNASLESNLDGSDYNITADWGNFNNFNASGNFSGGTLFINHIAEKTAGHDIIFDNNVDLADKTLTTAGMVTMGGLTITGNVFNNLLSNVHGGYNIGSGTNAFGNLYLTNTAHIPYLDVTTSVNSHLIPGTTDNYDLGDNTHNWNNAFINTLHADETGDLIPILTNSYSLGSGSKYWYYGYVTNLYYSTAEGGTIRPKVDSTYDLGSVTRMWDELYVDDIKFTTGDANLYFDRLTTKKLFFDDSDTALDIVGMDFRIPADNKNLVFGTGKDFKIGFDGTNAYLNMSTENATLLIQNSSGGWGMTIANEYAVATPSLNNYEGNHLDNIKSPNEMLTIDGKLNRDILTDIEKGVSEIKDENNCWEVFDYVTYCYKIEEDKEIFELCYSKPQNTSEWVVIDEWQEDVNRKECGTKSLNVTYLGSMAMENKLLISELLEKINKLEARIKVLEGEKQR